MSNINSESRALGEAPMTQTKKNNKWPTKTKGKVNIIKPPNQCLISAEKTN